MGFSNFHQDLISVIKNVFQYTHVRKCTGFVLPVSEYDVSAVFLQQILEVFTANFVDLEFAWSRRAALPLRPA